MSISTLFRRMSITTSTKSSFFVSNTTFPANTFRSRLIASSSIQQQQHLPLSSSSGDHSKPPRPTTHKTPTHPSSFSSASYQHKLKHKPKPKPKQSTTHHPNNTQSILAKGPDGTTYLIPPQPLGPYHLKRNAPKLAPYLVTQRLSQLKTTTGQLRNIRHSPWRLNLVCQFAARVDGTVDEVVRQLVFTEKVMAETVRKLIEGVADNARVKWGLRWSQLEVVECFSTHGTPLKRVEFMGRGRMGKKQHRHSHIRLVLREIDFPLKIIQSKTHGERDKWIHRMRLAEQEYEQSRESDEELEELEQQVKEMQRKKREKEEEEEEGKRNK